MVWIDGDLCGEDKDLFAHFRIFFIEWKLNLELSPQSASKRGLAAEETLAL